MGRQTIPMANGDKLVIGYDKPPIDSWFAYIHRAGSRYEADVIIGDAPAEVDLARAENPEVVVGPYPVDNPVVLCQELIPKFMGIVPEPEEKQRPCYSCKKPPWESNPDCRAHPYNRLHDQ
jgi:hypothetical protein